MRKVSSNLKYLRIYRGFSKAQLANKISIGVLKYSIKEKYPQLFTLEELKRIIKILNLSLEDLCNSALNRKKLTRF